MTPGGNLMKVTCVLKTIAMAGLLAFGTMSAYAANEMSATQKKQVEDVVHDYLLKNPEVLVQALQNFQQQQMVQARKTMEKTQESAPKFAKDLFQNTQDPVAGNPNGKITVVEFFDYQCPHCVDMAPVIDAVVKSNPDVRIVYKEFPIRGPSSDTAARAALAAKIQGKYADVHKALMAVNRALSEADVMKIVEATGVDMTKLKADMKSDAVTQQLKDTNKLAQSLQLIGTPAFFVAKSDVKPTASATAVVFIPGQVDQPQLESVIKKVNQ
jgi:protein-disulfide isomerase